MVGTIAEELVREALFVIRSLEQRQRWLYGSAAMMSLGLLLLWGWSFVAWLLWSPPALRGISGSVSYDAKPVALGEICFEQADDPLRRRPSTPIVDGTFSLPARHGLALGSRYRILITGFTPKPPTAEAKGRAVPVVTGVREDRVVYEQVIPARYNTATEILFDATSRNLHEGLLLNLR